MPNATDTIELALACDPHLARLVRMTAANVATLSSMSVDRVEDVRMAAEEAFIYACSVAPAGKLSIAFAVDAKGVSMVFTLPVDAFGEPQADDPAAYADLIITAVADAYEKTEAPAALHLELKADV